MQRTLPLFAALLATSSSASAQWTTGALSVARGDLSGAVVGDVALFAGGRIGNTLDGTVDLYDAATGSWSSTALSTPRVAPAAAVVGDLVLFAGGGVSPVNGSDVVDVYDAGNQTWSVAALSQPRGQIAAASCGTKAFFAGGVQSGLPSGVVDIYDAATGQWSVGALSVPRSGAAAAAVGTKVLFAGGTDGIGPFGTVDVYDCATGQWSTASLSVPRSLGLSAAVTVGTKVYFAGGRTSSAASSTSNVVDIYDDLTGAWSTTTLSTARHQVVALSVGNTALFAGGLEATPALSALVEVRHVGTGTWGTPMQLFSGPRSGHCGVTIGDRAIFAGGFAGAGTTAVVDFYEPVGVNYCAAAANSTGRAAGLVAVGSASLASNGLSLEATSLPAHAMGYFLVGRTQGLTQTPGGSQGDLCLGGAIGRYVGPGQVLNSGPAGAFQLLLDLTAIPSPTGPVAAQVGESWNFQCWYRDANPTSTSNFSEAVRVTVR